MKNRVLLYIAIIGVILYMNRAQIIKLVSRLGNSGLDLLKKFEGFRASVYLDIAGKPTIGYGHLILPGESFTRLSEEAATELLRRDASKAEHAVQQAVAPTSLKALTANQYDALTSLAFNIGATAFRGSTLVKLLNRGQVTQAADQFAVWNRYTDKNGDKVVSAGLTRRRLAERRLFETV